MNLEAFEDPIADRKIFKLTINGGELTRMTLTPLDKLLIEDCIGDNRSVADKLLALETIARRIEESNGS